MIGKSGPSFFDVLRTTIRDELNTPEVEAAAPAETRTLRTAELRPVIQQIEVAPPPEPMTPPLPQPMQATEPEPQGDPDQKTWTISQATAWFGALIGLIALLGSFYAGIRVGRMSQADPAATPVAKAAPATTAAAPEAAAPAPKPFYRIQLLQWKARTGYELEQQKRIAITWRKVLKEKGFPEAKISVNGSVVTLLYGRFEDRTDPAWKKLLDDLRAIEYAPASGRAKKYFAGADFVRFEG